MRFPIDVLFLGRDGRVLRVYRDLRPGRLTRLVLGARGALELPAGTAERTGTVRGDVVDLGFDLDPERPPPQPAVPVRVLAATVALAWGIHGAAAVGYLVGAGVQAGRAGFPLDDAWIHLVYARSLVEGDGFAYNPGEPEGGSTAPLWTAALAGALAIGGADDPRLPALALGIGVSLALLAATLALGRRLGATAHELGALAVILALDPGLVFGAVSGMEVSLAALGLVAVVGACCAGRFHLAAFALGLATLVRPECAAVSPVLAWARLARRDGRVMLDLLAMAILWAIPLLPWAAFLVQATGSPLPNTFHVKARFAFRFANVLRAASELSLTGGALLAGVGWILYGAGLLGLAKRCDAGTRRALIGVAWAFVVAQVATRSFVGLPYFYWDRYFVPALPLLDLPIAFAVAAGLSRLRSTDRPVALVAGAGVAVLLAQVVVHGHRYAGNVRNVEEMQVAAGSWIERHAGPDDRVATADAGAVRYLGRRETLDLVGLNSHRMLVQGRARWLELARFDPDYLVIFPKIEHRLARGPVEEVLRLRSVPYTVTPDVARQSELVVYRVVGPLVDAGAGPPPPSLSHTPRMGFAIGKGLEALGLAITGLGLAIGLSQNDLVTERDFLYAGIVVFTVGWLIESRSRADG